MSVSETTNKLEDTKNSSVHVDSSSTIPFVCFSKNTHAPLNEDFHEVPGSETSYPRERHGRLHLVLGEKGRRGQIQQKLTVIEDDAAHEEEEKEAMNGSAPGGFDFLSWRSPARGAAVRCGSRVLRAAESPSPAIPRAGPWCRA